MHAHILQQDPRHAPAVPERPLKQPENMSHEAGRLPSHASLQASAAHIDAREACCYQLGLLQRLRLSPSMSPFVEASVQ